MVGLPSNQLETAFLKAAEDPTNVTAFEKFLIEAQLVVPCQVPHAGLKAGQRLVKPPPGIPIQLKAYRQDNQWIVPFFSDLQRFEVWSAPDPEGTYACVRGQSFSEWCPRALLP